jgi:hypothetical protein
VAKLVIEASITWAENNGRGGRTMHMLQWVNGLRALGHDVLFYDELSPKDDRLEDERADELAQWFGDIMTRWWDPRRSAAVVRSGRPLFGLTVEEIAEFARDADAVIGLGCGWDPPPWLESVRPRILIDLDPGLTQFWGEEVGIERIIGDQDYHFTFGANVGRGAEIPTLGIEWRPLWPPVVLDWWSNDGRRERDTFTTISSLWDGEWRELGGKLWGPKGEQLEQFVRLPELAEEPIEIAVDELDESAHLVGELRGAGWRVEYAAELVSSPEAYRDYVLASAGEFSTAKGLYVGTRSGWFSDRSACYLAAGRPVVVEDTGIAEHIPTGEGLFSVGDVEEAAHAIRTIRADYDRHAAAARKLAADYFDAGRALRPLLDVIEDAA